MRMENRKIGRAPCALYGEPAEGVFLFVHGQCGCKEEAARFAPLAEARGWQVLAIDLPEHGGRTDGATLTPWDAIPELQEMMRFAKKRWSRIAVRAISIGAWLSLQAFAGEGVERCLLSSPLLDMEDMILSLMRAADVSEAQLKARGEIAVPEGATLSWRYLTWVREHPTLPACDSTAILYADGDELIPRRTIDRFVERFACRLTVYPGGQHWLHTEEECAFMRRWEESEMASLKVESTGNGSVDSAPNVRTLANERSLRR